MHGKVITKFKSQKEMNLSLEPGYYYLDDKWEPEGPYDDYCVCLTDSALYCCSENVDNTNLLAQIGI